MEKFNVSVILPIKSSRFTQFEDYFNKAITSLKSQTVQINELVIVHTVEEQLIEYLNNYDFGDINVKKVEWTSEPSFCNQVNFGAQNSSSEWSVFNR